MILVSGTQDSLQIKLSYGILQALLQLQRATLPNGHCLLSS
ncbi:hypothetical protein [Yersinia phage vB_YenM_P778]